MRRKLLVFLGTALVIAQAALAQQGDVSAYIDRYKTLAMEEMVRTGIPAAISLAQGLVESGAGTSWLSVHANNQFGIKCKSDWQGESVNHHDDRRNECFRKYASPADSWRDHSNFLKAGDRYQFLFFLDPMDYKAWAYGLKQAGYATSNRYARQLIETIQKYDLNQYSRQGLAMSRKQEPESEFAALLNKKVEQEQPGTTGSPAGPVVSSDSQAQRYPAKLFQINKRAVLFQPAGTQLIALAQRYDLPLRRLLRYNELDSDVLPRSMLVFIEKKRKKGDHATHQVQAGETYHEIAQEEGIRLKSLLKRNHLDGHGLPQPGSILVLKGTAPTAAEAAAPRPKRRGFFARLFGGKQQNPAPAGPAGTASPEPAQPLAESATDNKRNATFVYKVQSGDTLYGIAQKYKVAVDRIREANHLQGDLIQTGQQLRIPKN